MENIWLMRSLSSTIMWKLSSSVIKTWNETLAYTVNNEVI